MVNKIKTLDDIYNDPDRDFETELNDFFGIKCPECGALDHDIKKSKFINFRQSYWSYTCSKCNNYWIEKHGEKPIPKKQRL
jgi:ssDNA-binding Zn-finger/Zn-ribbon topoisomerase 1